MLDSLYRHIRRFGIKGIRVFFYIGLNYTKKIFLPNIIHPITLRNGTSDIRTFNQVFLHNDYNIPLSFAPKAIVDAGANIGLSTVFFKNKYPAAKIIAIEPENSNIELLKKNTINYENIYLLKKALSNVSNQDMNVNDSGNGHWGFVTVSTKNSENGVFKNSVKTITINDIMKENELEFIDILKIDIEGAEKELFESNIENWLPKIRCLIIELHDRTKPGSSKSFFKAISKYDFSFSSKGENLVFINKNIQLQTIE